MANAWLDIYAQFTDLSEEDKRQSFEAIKNDVDSEPRKVIGLYEGIRESRFRNGLACVHCGRCINDISGTPLSLAHIIQKSGCDIF